MNMICRCGPRYAIPRGHVVDALGASRSRRASDPTGTLPLQRRFMRDIDLRWNQLRRMIPTALAARADAVSAITHAQITGDDPVRAFQGWLDEAMRQLVIGTNGSWTLSYVRSAGDIALHRAQGLVAPAAPPADRIPQLQTLTITELQGVCEAVSQQAVRMFANGLLTKQPISKITRTVQQVIDTVGQARSHLVISFICVRAFSAVTLDSFRAANLTHVGTVAERTRLEPAPSSHSLVRDAKKSKSKSKAKKKPAAFAGPDELVEVLTAGDDLVCQVCEDISDEGPYTLDDAEMLIPAHPRCRCAFVPWDDNRFADVHADDAFNPDEPRDTKGKWTSGGDIGFDPDQYVGRPAEEARYQAVSWYQAGGYHPINTALRSTKPLSKKIKENVRALDSLIASSRVKQNMSVWRGVAENKKLSSDLFKVGKEITLKGYTSTTTSKSMADNFGAGTMKFQIDIPKGARALEIKGEEKEILLPRNSRFKVLSIKSKDYGIGSTHVIHLGLKK